MDTAWVTNLSQYPSVKVKGGSKPIPPDLRITRAVIGPFQSSAMHANNSPTHSRLKITIDAKEIVFVYLKAFYKCFAVTLFRHN